MEALRASVAAASKKPAAAQEKGRGVLSQEDRRGPEVARALGSVLRGQSPRAPGAGRRRASCRSSRGRSAQHSSRQMRITSSRSMPVSFDSSSGVRWFAILAPSIVAVFAQARKSPPRTGRRRAGLQNFGSPRGAGREASLAPPCRRRAHSALHDNRSGDGCDGPPARASRSAGRAPRGARIRLWERR